MAGRVRWLGPTVVTAWLLIAPPYGGPPQLDFRGVGCGDPGHLNECAPLSYWRRLGTFPSRDACRQGRDDGIAAAHDDDTRWADWSLSRCFDAERVQRGPGLQPGE